MVTISSVTRNIFQTLRNKIVNMILIVVVVIVVGSGGGVTIVSMEIRHPTSCQTFSTRSATNSKYLLLFITQPTNAQIILNIISI